MHAPDYCFRIGGSRKFFLEAKKPSVSIKDAVHPAYQLRRYAWSAKLPLSILMDFEEFAVYDCRVRPNPDDNASIGRLMYLTHRDYVSKWDEIESVFSREAVLKGSFDKFAEDKKGKRGTAEMDDAFLKEIESWRDSLARNIAVRNPSMSTQELNFAVQRTIDRIIFLRICEDRGIEHYGRLMALLNGVNVYKRLVQVFYDADDKQLKEIIQSLYYPQCPYEFSVLPADILGQVYEQFLGKVIRLTFSHRAVVEDKPEVKKAGGVYYTPTYIVDYIVKNTVGRLLENRVQGSGARTQGKGPGGLSSSSVYRGGISGGTGDPSGNRNPAELPVDPTDGKNGRPDSKSGKNVDKTNPKSPNPLNPKPWTLDPKKASKLKILDPACGSGSFLIGAYQYLLDWYRDRYVEEGPEKHVKGREPRLYQAHGGEWKLTTPERKRILLNHIYGVDIDPQAVEVTKLSLLLKVLEGQTENTLTSQLKLFHERVLPDLCNNIKCGNSLIGPDFYEHQQMSILDDDERRRINVFDWNAEFPEIMKAGGFDAVIGNPPYVRQETLGEIFKEYAKTHYKSYAGTADLYSYFIERGVNLLNERGIFSIIVANKWMRANYGEALRRWMKEHQINEIIDFGDLPVFKNATTYPCIISISRKPPSKPVHISKVSTLSFNDLDEYIILAPVSSEQFFA